jgi:hypothetical protein
MADTSESLETALALIRSDLDRIKVRVHEQDRTMSPLESTAVVRYVSALVEAQRSEMMADKAAAENSKQLPPATLLRELAVMPAVREMLEENDPPKPPAKGKRKQGAE